MLLLKQNNKKKERIKNVRELDAGHNCKKYKVEIIWRSTIYTNKVKSHLLGLYYLVA